MMRCGALDFADNLCLPLLSPIVGLVGMAPYTSILTKATFPVIVAVMVTFVMLMAAKAIDGPISAESLLHRLVEEKLAVAVAGLAMLPFAVLIVYGVVLSLGPKGSREAFKE
jgi:hypothetical protein